MVAGASARYRGRTRRPDFPSNPILPSFREQIIRGTGDKPFDPLPDTIGFTAMFTTPFDHETPHILSLPGEAFVLGVKVQDKIVVRYIFEVPKDKDMGGRNQTRLRAGCSIWLGSSLSSPATSSGSAQITSRVESNGGLLKPKLLAILIWPSSLPPRVLRTAPLRPGSAWPGRIL
jgi:hypothetical protein